jgi:hypothetical protein
MSWGCTRTITRSGPTASGTGASTRANCTSHCYSKCWAPRSRSPRWRRDCGAAVADCEARAWKRAIGVRRAMAVAAYRGRGWDLLRAAAQQFLGDRPARGRRSLRACCVHATTRRGNGCAAAVNARRWIVVRDRFSRVIESQALRSADGRAGRDAGGRGIDCAAKGGRWRMSRATARSSSVMGRTSGCVSRSSTTSRGRPVRPDVRTGRDAMPAVGIRDRAGLPFRPSAPPWLGPAPVGP